MLAARMCRSGVFCMFLQQLKW